MQQERETTSIRLRYPTYIDHMYVAFQEQETKSIDNGPFFPFLLGHHHGLSFLSSISTTSTITTGRHWPPLTEISSSLTQLLQSNTNAHASVSIHTHLFSAWAVWPWPP